MNHTIKGIIIVIAIASMLVVGATMVPIMQNSFAHKRSAEPDPNTNTNTNTADSSSSSTAVADNTNNVNNTATATQSQEQSACAVAITCPEGSTTVTTTTPPTATCNPSTIVGQTATRTDDICTAFSDGLSGTQQEEFAN
jgi:cytoskeletal protein RodZ